MATIQFRANINQAVGANPPTDPLVIPHTAPSNSGIGFYGGDFGLSVPVGQPQETTFVTNDQGTDQGVRLQNTKWLSASQVEIMDGSTKNLTDMCNYYAPLNIRFTHTSPVRTQTCKLRIFDRQDITKAAIDVDTYAWEVRHPNPDENGPALSHRGDSSSNWKTFPGRESSQTTASEELTLTSSPGTSGLNTLNSDSSLPLTTNGFKNYETVDGNGHLSTQHDWYLALSAEPTSIGSKTNFGLYFTLEYLD
jgi:hypothetical protein